MSPTNVSRVRKMDMLNGDLSLKNEAMSRKKSKAINLNEDDDASFHFIAFVPVQGKVWKLDGLERQPQILGKAPRTESLGWALHILILLGPILKDDWVVQAAPNITAQMAQYEEGQIEFVILSLLKEPLIDLVADLAKNVKGVDALSSRLNNINPGWREYLTTPQHGNLEENDFLVGPSARYRLEADAIDGAILSSAFRSQLESESMTNLLKMWQDLVANQARIRASINDEQETTRLDEERAMSRRNDKGLLAKGLIEVLERMGKVGVVLEELT